MSVPIVIGCIASTVIFGGVVLSATEYAVTAVRVGGAADAAALAAADALMGDIEAEPCTIALQVADASGVSLTGCMVNESTWSVRVETRCATVLGSASAAAAAGPMLVAD